jgi:hypothetical protein
MDDVGILILEETKDLSLLQEIENNLGTEKIFYLLSIGGTSRR